MPNAKKRELSPESKNRQERPLQQQKSISDIIGPLVAGVNLSMPEQMTTTDSLDDLAAKNGAQSLDDLAAKNAAQTAAKASSLGSNGSSRQNSSESDSIEDPCVVRNVDPLDAGLTDAGLTDVDGLLSEMVKGARKVSGKAAKKVAKSVETVVHGSMQVVKDAAENIEDVVEDAVEGGLDLVGEVTHAASGMVGLAGACVLQKQLSLQEQPSNNVYISHPDEGAANMISMGMNITFQEFKNGSGQLVLMIEPGKLADQAKLQEGDVIIAVGDRDVSTLPVNEALHIFGYIASTFSMTVIRRETSDDGVDIPVLVKKTITVNVHLNEDNLVAIEVLDIRCTTLAYEHRREVYFQHKFSLNDDPYFMQVHNNTLRMTTQSDPECCFFLNRYTDIHNNCTPCAIQHKNSPQALGVQADQQNNSHTVALTGTQNLQGEDSPLIDADLRFFHMHTINSSGEILLESSYQKEYFLAVDSPIEEHEGFSTRQLILCHHPYSNHNELDDSIEYKFRFRYTDI